MFSTLTCTYNPGSITTCTYNQRSYIPAKHVLKEHCGVRTPNTKQVTTQNVWWLNINRFKTVHMVTWFYCARDYCEQVRSLGQLKTSPPQVCTVQYIDFIRLYYDKKKSVQSHSRWYLTAWLHSHDFVLVCSSSKYPNVIPLCDKSIWNMSDRNLDLSKSLKIRSGVVFVFRVFDFLLVLFNGNIWPISVLRDISTFQGHL